MIPYDPKTPDGEYVHDMHPTKKVNNPSVDGIDWEDDDVCPLCSCGECDCDYEELDSMEEEYEVRMPVNDEKVVDKIYSRFIRSNIDFGDLGYDKGDAVAIFDDEKEARRAKIAMKPFRHSSKNRLPTITKLSESKLDPVGKEDEDVDNDGDVDKSDKYLANRRKAIAKAMNKKKIKESISSKSMMNMNKVKDSNVKKGNYQIFKRATGDYGVRKAIDGLYGLEWVNMTPIHGGLKTSDDAKSMIKRKDKTVDLKNIFVIEETLDEISQEKLKRYHAKAGSSYQSAKKDVEDSMNKKPTKKRIAKGSAGYKTMQKRKKGMDLAAKKMHEETLDESKISDYLKKAKSIVSTLNKMSSAEWTPDQIGTYNSIKDEMAAVQRKIDRLEKESRSKKKINEEKIVYNGREYEIKKFNSDSSANDFLEKNPKWGVLTTKNSTVYVAQKSDKGRPIKESTTFSKFKKGILKLADQTSVTVSEKDAMLLNQMFGDLNPKNQKEMEKILRTDKSGYNEILGFAKEAL